MEGLSRVGRLFDRIFLYEYELSSFFLLQILNIVFYDRDTVNMTMIMIELYTLYIASSFITLWTTFSYSCFVLRGKLCLLPLVMHRSTLLYRSIKVTIYTCDLLKFWAWDGLCRANLVDPHASMWAMCLRVGQTSRIVSCCS